MYPVQCNYWKFLKNKFWVLLLLFKDNLQRWPKIMCIWTSWFFAWLHPEGELTFFLSNCPQSSRNQFRYPCGLYFPASHCIFYRSLFPVPLCPQMWLSWNSERFKSMLWSEQIYDIPLLLRLINLGHSRRSLQASVFLSPTDTVKSRSEPCCYDLIFLQTERFNLFRYQTKGPQTYNSPGYSNLAAWDLKNQ